MIDDLQKGSIFSHSFPYLIYDQALSMASPYYFCVHTCLSISLATILDHIHTTFCPDYCTNILPVLSLSKSSDSDLSLLKLPSWSLQDTILTGHFSLNLKLFRDSLLPMVCFSNCHTRSFMIAPAASLISEKSTIDSSRSYGATCGSGLHTLTYLSHPSRFFPFTIFTVSCSSYFE